MNAATNLFPKTGLNPFISGIVSTFLLLGAAQSAQAAQYYINNLPGAGCSDLYEGTTPENPWCTLEKVSYLDLEPGDAINLARGATWSEQTLRVDENDNGTLTNPVRIQAYGAPELPRPHITSSKNSFLDQRPLRGIVLKNASHWEIKDLEISHVGAGILFHYTSKNNQNIKLSNLYLHHIYGYVAETEFDSTDDIEFSAGILFTGRNISLELGESVIRDIVIENVVGTRNQDSIAIDFPPSIAGAYGAQKVAAARNVLLNRLHLFKDDANRKSTSCNDSLRLVKVSSLTLMNSLLEDEAGCYAKKGTTAVFIGYSEKTSLINNIIRNTPYTGSPDESAVDLEIDNNGFKMFGNLISGNYQGVECMMFHGAEFPCDINVSNNAFIYNRRSALFAKGDLRKPTGFFKHNFYYGVSGSYLKFNNMTNDTGQRFDQTNDAFSLLATTENDVETNVTLPNPEMFFSAAGDFKTTQSPTERWAYQYFDAASGRWEDFANYDTATQTHPIWNRGADDKTLFVSPFEMKPTAAIVGRVNSGAVARIWRAPRNGTIMIRGQVAKSEVDPSGNGVLVWIEKYDAQLGSSVIVWPRVNAKQNIGNSNLEGVASNLDIAVKAGDIIRFLANSNGDGGARDTVSWAPLIAYKDGPQSMAWQFNSYRWLEYWARSSPTMDFSGMLAPGVEADGSLRLSINGPDPWFLSRNFKNVNKLLDLGLSGKDYKTFSMRIKHTLKDVSSTRAVLKWAVVGDETFNDSRKMEIFIGGGNEFQDIGPIDMSAYWTDDTVITQLRIEPIDDPVHEAQNPTVWIDSIRLDGRAL